VTVTWYQVFYPEDETFSLGFTVPVEKPVPLALITRYYKVFYSSVVT
jgi:hypothetical protein